jgi:hypothetical protein
MATRSRRLALLLTAVAGCAPSGTRPIPSSTPDLRTVIVGGTLERTATVDLRNEAAVGERLMEASVGEVWAVLPAVFAQLEIEPTTVDASAAVMGNPAYRARRVEGQRMSRYLDCGRVLGRDYADSYEITLGVMIQLAPGPDGRAYLRTVVDAYARDRGVSGNPVHCITWGSLERRIAELVTEKLGA